MRSAKICLSKKKGAKMNSGAEAKLIKEALEQ